LSNESSIKIIADWTLRLRPGKGQQILVLLHGWTGDENSMSVFMRGIPEDYWLLAPRGVYKAYPFGYSWQTPVSHGSRSDIESFRNSVEALVKFLDLWKTECGLSTATVDIMGFSQGGAFAFSFGAMKPDLVNKVIILSGFAPEGIEEYLQPEIFRRKKFFVAHGEKDEIVPISRAFEIVNYLQGAGAELEFCQSDSGHKVSARSFNSLLQFINK